MLVLLDVVNECNHLDLVKVRPCWRLGSEGCSAPPPLHPSAPPPLHPSAEPTPPPLHPSTPHLLLSLITTPHPPCFLKLCRVFFQVFNEGFIKGDAFCGELWCEKPKAEFRNSGTYTLNLQYFSCKMSLIQNTLLLSRKTLSNNDNACHRHPAVFV